jgi:hypothetical protein
MIAARPMAFLTLPPHPGIRDMIELVILWHMRIVSALPVDPMLCCGTSSALSSRSANLLTWHNFNSTAQFQQFIRRGKIPTPARKRSFTHTGFLHPQMPNHILCFCICQPLSWTIVESGKDQSGQEILLQCNTYSTYVRTGTSKICRGWCPPLTAFDSLLLDCQIRISLRRSQILASTLPASSRNYQTAFCSGSPFLHPQPLFHKLYFVQFSKISSLGHFSEQTMMHDRLENLLARKDERVRSQQPGLGATWEKPCLISFEL